MPRAMRDISLVGILYDHALLCGGSYSKSCVCRSVYDMSVTVEVDIREVYYPAQPGSGE